MPARTTASVSMPAARMPSTSPKWNPSSRSITSIRRVTSVGWGRGTTKSRWSSAAKIMAMSSMFSASRRKSSSSRIVSAKSSTRAGGLASAATGMRPTRCGASHAITARSWRTRAETEGRWSFTTTGVPSRSVAAWTWAIDAAANEVRSTDENTVPMGCPSSSVSTRPMTGHGSAGTWSRHHLNSATSSGGKMPSPEAMIWPSLM